MSDMLPQRRVMCAQTARTNIRKQESLIQFLWHVDNLQQRFDSVLVDQTRVGSVENMC